MHSIQLAFSVSVIVEKFMTLSKVIIYFKIHFAEQVGNIIERKNAYK